MEHKVGQMVKIKSLDWYNKNKDILGNIECGDALMNIQKSQFCGKIVTISSISDVTDTYKIEEDNGQYIWTDEMIEGLVEEETKSKYEDEVTGEYYSTPKYLVRPNGYQFVDENGNVINATKIVLEKKKKEYPKSFEECCEVLGILNVDLCFNADYRSFSPLKEQWKKLGLMNQFYHLLICRDAYRKIAGEEMGLGKPWEPDWKNSEERRYCIVNIEGDINLPEKTLTKWILKVTNKILVFPTEEMRDAFKENFDPDIEICKEFL